MFNDDNRMIDDYLVTFFTISAEKPINKKHKAKIHQMQECNGVNISIIFIHIVNKYFKPYLLLALNIICVTWNIKISIPLLP